MKPRRLRALGGRTKESYARVLERAFGDGAAPDRLPDLSSGGRHGGQWPEPSRVTLRAAVMRYWAEQGEPEKGERLAARIEAVEHEKRDKARPTEAEIKRLEKVLKVRQQRGEKAATLCVLALQTGARAQELLTLDPDALRSALAYGKLQLNGKGKKSRFVPVFDRTRATLRLALDTRGNLPHDSEQAMAQYNDTEPAWRVLGHLLAKPSSEFSTQYNLLSRYVKDVAREAGLDASKWSPHTLRRIYASRLTRGGAPISVVQKALGHRFSATTEKYVDVEVEDIGQFGRFV